MSNKTILYFALGAAGTAAVGGWLYKNGANNLVFDISGFAFAKDGTLLITLAVTNPNRFFGYPVPQFNLTATDGNGNIIGTITNSVLQYIATNADTLITGTVTPNYLNLTATALTSLASQAVPTGITLTGTATIGPFQIPITINT